nr:PREDICTED: uncharacterized protein LOC109030185 [Bemisia tabaci]
MLNSSFEEETIDGLDKNVKLSLDGLQLKQYHENFRKHRIDIDLFFTLTNDDLKNIGIEDEEHRKILVKATTKPTMAVQNESIRPLKKEEADAILTNSFKYLTVLKLFIKELDPTRKKNEIRNTALNSEASAADGIVTFSNAAIKCLQDLRLQYCSLLPEDSLKKAKRKSAWITRSVPVLAVLLTGALVSHLIWRKLNKPI